MRLDIPRLVNALPLRRVVTFLAVSAMTIPSSACGPTEPEGCDICTTSGIVEGTITHQDGSPVSGVQLDVRAFRDSCGADADAQAFGGTDNGWPVTRADGSYEAQPISIFGPLEAHCLRLTLNPRDDARWLAKVSAEFERTLEFRADYRGPSHDRVLIDWALDDGADGK